MTQLCFKAWFWFNRFCVKQSVKVLVICVLSLFFALSLSHSKTLKRDGKVCFSPPSGSDGEWCIHGLVMILEEMEISHLGLVSQGDYRVVTELNLRWNKLQEANPFVRKPEVKITRHNLLKYSLGLISDVGNNHLVGTIRELIRFDGSFPSLRNLYLNNNYLSGGIPAQLSNLTNLETVPVLQQVHWKHSFCAIAHIPKLTFLRIPDAFCKHPFLKE
ncbi:hypothetical protein HID58_049753, partial [Brassica napus]